MNSLFEIKPKLDKVLCATWTEYSKSSYGMWDQENWLADRQIKINKKFKITPLIDHPHSDKENGQKETHQVFLQKLLPKLKNKLLCQ